jgi:hypothetical protein
MVHPCRKAHPATRISCFSTRKSDICTAVVLMKLTALQRHPRCITGRFPCRPGSSVHNPGFSRSRFGIMDPAVCFPVICSVEKRTVPQRPAMVSHPVPYSCHAGQIFKSNILSVQPFSIGKLNGNVLQDVLTITFDPRDDIPDHALLPPTPFLATAAALPAVLVRCHGHIHPHDNTDRNSWLSLFNEYSCRMRKGWRPLGKL